MPARNGQLDEISEAIGGLRASVDGIEKYMHDREHGLNNLSQKVDALGVRIGKDIAAVEARLEARIQALEVAHQQTAGAKNLVVWILQSPLIGWIAAAALFFAAWMKGAKS